MKKKILFYIGLILVGSTVSSCSDFLQKDPPSSPSEAIFPKKIGNSRKEKQSLA